MQTSSNPDRRLHLYQILTELDDDQLRTILTNHFQNSSAPNQFQHYTRLQLYQQCLSLVNNYCTTELEQTLYAMRQKRYSSDYQQQNFSSSLNQQKQQNSVPSFNQQQQSFYYPQQTTQYNTQPPNYRFSSPAITQQLRAIRPNTISSQSIRPTQSQSSYPSLLARHQQNRNGSGVASNNTGPPIVQRFQVPLLPSPSITSTPAPPPVTTSSPTTVNVLSINNPSRFAVNKIIHKSLPFYRPITCIYERYRVFRYDTYRKQYISRDEFTLSFDVCNQLALSYDFDVNLNMHKTSKCLLLRLVRTDQPPTFNGKYEDSLPPNVLIHVNGHQLKNLPIPKASTRQQNDLIRIGREVDITSYCMFNPMLKNEITISWSYRPDNTVLQMQYSNAQYALHIYLVEHLTIGELYEQIIKKPMRFFREDLVRLLAKAHANDRDLGLEVSDQKLKLTCPIDQRRLKTPVRATTCQHLQCFDLKNYIGINEKSNKWTCPVCNKSALYEDLQIDSYTESILDSINNENVIEITINSDLNWSPIIPSNSTNESSDSESNIKFAPVSSSNDIICLDDDDDN